MTAPHTHTRAARHPRECRSLHPDPVIVRAAQWLADQDNPPHPVMVEIQDRFGLAPAIACEVHDLAGRMRMLRRAFG